MYPEKTFFTNLVWKTNNKSWDVYRPLLSPSPNSNQTTTKQQDFFKKVTFQELEVHKSQIFSWSSTFLT